MIQSFDTDIASEYGIEESIVIELFKSGIKGNIGKKQYYFNGKNWTSITERELKASLPYFTPKKIAALIASLLEKGVLVTCHLQDAKYSWYSFMDEGAWLSDFPPVQLKGKKKAKKLSEEESFFNALPIGLVEGKRKSLYERMMSTYYGWHKQCIGVEPLIDGREGKALKSLAIYFMKIAINRAIRHCTNTGESLTQELVLVGATMAWSNLLIGLNTGNIDPFLKKQKKISQIYHNLTNIIDQLKNGKRKEQPTATQPKPSSSREQSQQGLDDLDREIAMAASMGKY